MAQRNQTVWIWLLAILPIGPLALVFWSHHVPSEWEERQQVIRLAGEWQAFDLGTKGETLTPAGPVHLPGPLGITSGRALLRKHVDLPEPLQRHDLFLVLGDARGAQANVSVNGQLIGKKGEATTGFIGAEAGVDGWTIPAGVAGASFDLDIELNSGERAGITDNRILLGRHELLAPWHFQFLSVRNFFELGSLLLLLVLSAAVTIIWRLQGERADRPLYRGTLLMAAATATYLLAKSGLGVSAVLSRDGVGTLVVLSVYVGALALPEYCEAYFLKRVTWFRQVNRVVCALAILGTLVSPFGVYRLVSPWLFVVLVYFSALAVRDVAQRRTLMAPLLGSASVLMTLAGINDLLGDRDLLFTPRVFTVGMAGLAVIVAVVAIGEFLLLAEENTVLSVSLKGRNEELADALVKAHESARVKSEFLANTSHELRTPLNAIINIPQGLLEQFHEMRRLRCSRCRALFALEDNEPRDARCPECGQAALTEEHQLAMNLDVAEAGRLLASVVGSGKHLLAVVNDILDYSKLEAGRVVLQLELVRARELFDELRLTMESVAAHAGVTLALEPPPEVELEVDRVKLLQVLINLVGNAIKFSDGKGTVAVRGELAGQGEQRSLVISVSDEGIGIAPEHQQLIFEGFRQVEGTSTRRFGGTGLGLAISKTLVIAHGGELRLRSAPGKGSTFSVELPLVRPAQETAPSGARVILVVDDETTALDTTAVALKPLGCRVVGVRDPREAVERIRSEHAALVVLDVMMPRVSGLEVLRQLRADPQLSKVAVLVSSAYPDNRDAVEALGASFLAKPWRPGEILREASKLLAAKAVGVGHEANQ